MISEGFERRSQGDLPLDHLSSISQTIFCPFGAPLFAIVWNGNATIQQSCCNHWECPICGKMRAEQEYKRIVYGATELAKQQELYFWTLTCRGKECSLEEAEENYYAWTNVLLTAARAKAKRANQYWAYCQVTERQHKTRQHPHSHLVCTFLPKDAVGSIDARGHKVYISAWFAKENYRASLGNQHRITKVDSPIAVSRYIAKYMKKQTMIDVWPAHWKRVRYSQNWPELPTAEPDYCKPLLKRLDWEDLDKTNFKFTCPNEGIYIFAKHRTAAITL